MVERGRPRAAWASRRTQFSTITNGTIDDDAEIEGLRLIRLALTLLATIPEKVNSIASERMQAVINNAARMPEEQEEDGDDQDGPSRRFF